MMRLSLRPSGQDEGKRGLAHNRSGVGRIGGGSFGSNLGSPVRVGGSTRLHYCNQGHAASGSGFGCPSGRVGRRGRNPVGRGQ
jgi:hypothetical protein